MGQSENWGPVGVMGWGRFGRALGGLAQRTGAEVWAYEPYGEVEPEVRVDTLRELAARCPWVLVAVPIGQLGPALRALRPYLGAHHRVLDVGSVKVRPEEVLRRELGSDIPWVATHPLFGPVSLARGERPLRVVVCPNPLHPAATDQAIRWYAHLGCEVTAQTADEHDRSMANSHALAFFLAKGLLDMGADVQADLIPPSFRALESTIQAVRADAGHLFQAIQLQNPFSAAARERLLRALGDIHVELAELEADASEDAAPKVSIPDLGEHDPLKKPTAARLEEVDRELIELIARRADLRAQTAFSNRPDRGSTAKAGVDAALIDRVFALLDE